MTEGWGDLNGSGPQQIYINVYREGGPVGNGYNYRIIVQYLANGYGSWTNNTQYWSANAGGAGFSGTWNIPYGNRYDNITLLNTTFYREHDANGYGSGFWSSASIDTDHSSIGDGSVGVSEGTPPRIPKAPSACGTPSFSQIGPTSMRVDFSAPADDGGTGILEYRIRHADNSGMTGATTVSTGTNRFTTIGSLPPGAARYVQASARNGVGWGPWSSVGSAETPKAPSACGTPSFSQIGPTSMRVDFAAPADDGGTGILEYRVRHADNVGMTGATTVSTGGNRFATIGSLPPGAARYVQASARNGVGWGPWSNVGSASTISGGSVKRSGAWTAGRANDKTGGAWSPSVVMKKTGGAWGAAR